MLKQVRNNKRKSWEATYGKYGNNLVHIEDGVSVEVLWKGDWVPLYSQEELGYNVKD